MAQMPKGRPRSVPDLADEQYVTTLGRERLKQLHTDDVAAKNPPSIFAGPVPRLSKFDTLRNAPRPISQVSIGGRTYRGVDDGHANILVPVDFPELSPQQRAQLRRSIERVSFMADHPLGSLAYDIATLANASSDVRDGALVAGGTFDTAIMVRGPKVANVRSQPSFQRPKYEPPSVRRQQIRYGRTNEIGQATGVTATLTKPMLGTGSKAYWRRTPPSYQGNRAEDKQARGHLLAKQLGGSGKDSRNLVTLTHKGANHPQMSGFENEVARRVRSGEVIEYSATPIYHKGVLPPAYILLAAPGSRRMPAPRIIQNPAGRRR